MTLKIVALSSLLLTLSACGGGSSSSKSDDNKLVFNEDLRAAAKAAPPLTADQKMQIAAWMKVDKALVPKVELYFDKYATDRERNQDLAPLNDQGKQLLARAKADCEIIPEKKTKTGSLEVGKTETTQKTRFVTGNKCPIYYSNSETVAATLTQLTKIEPDNYLISSTTKKTKETSEKILDPQLRKKLVILDKTTRLEGTSTMENAIVDKKGNLTSGRVHISDKLTSTALAEDGTKVVSTAITEVIAVPNESRSQMLMETKFPKNITLVFGYFTVNNQVEIFVNGQSYTEKQFMEEFSGLTEPNSGSQED